MRRGRPPGHARVVVLALATLVAAGVGAPAAAEAGPRTVRVGVYQNKPKVFTDESGRPAGLFVELLTEIAAAEDWDLSFVECRWSECLRQLEAGRIDLMPDVAYTRERDRIFDFHSRPVLESWSQFYARAESSINALPDLQGKRVAVLRGSVQHDTFAQMMTGFGFAVTIVPTESHEAALRAVRDGAADAAITNHFFGAYFHREYGLTRTAIVFQPAELYFATAQGDNPDLLAAIDGRLQAWRRQANSPYYATLNRWMERPPVQVVSRRILWVIAIVISLLLLAAGMILLLRFQIRAKTRHLVQANQELRQTEASLRSSEALLNSAQHLGRMGGWEWDLEREETHWTEETYLIHDIPRGADAPGSRDLMERNFACYEPEARAALRDALARCCEQGERFELEAQFRSEGGRELWVRTNAEAVRDARGRVVKVVGNIMDVTESRAAEKERRALEDQLRQAQKMEAIGKLAGGIAHDFNNLLTVILSYTHLALASLGDDDGARDDLDEVVKAGERAALLTRQLLAFSRRQIFELKAVDLNQVATGIEKMLRRIIGEDIDLRLSLAPARAAVLADPGQLEQVIMNLVVNARDAMPTGGTLTIEIANVELDQTYLAGEVDVSPGRFVLLAVSDQGTGMDEATRARIFEPFFTTKELGEGTGLGLSTVYGIVKQSGGFIHVDSEPGRGTMFRVYIPHDTSAPSAEPPAHAPSAPTNGVETILVVEDDRAVRDIAVRILRSAGYTVLAAADADDAVRTAESQREPIHLLLTDVVMPGARGDELATRLTSARPEMKVLYMSGYPGSASDRIGGPRSAARFVAKPFSIEQLTTRVRQCLDEA